MPISKHEEKMINLQYQLRNNQSELKDYLADLDSWENDIKQKEAQLKSEKTSVPNQNTDLPPVRNTIHKKKLKKKKKEAPVNPNKAKKISGFDFRAWDKFDVDKALEEVDKEEKKQDTSSSEYETDEEWEIERKKHLAGLEKDKGNEFLKKGEYDKAVEAYTKGMEYDATNAILPANRALALLKQQKFAAAELDCTSSISLDPLYVKAYLRRATARSAMGKLDEGIADYNRVLDLEPSNKQAKTELERLNKELERGKEKPVTSSLTEGEKGVVKPIYKPPEERSKVPLKHILIEEIGLETNTRVQPGDLKQSDVAKKITEKEGEEFDKLFTLSVGSSSPSLSSSNWLPVSSDNVVPNIVSSEKTETNRLVADKAGVESSASCKSSVSRAHSQTATATKELPVATQQNNDPLQAAVDKTSKGDLHVDDEPQKTSPSLTNGNKHDTDSGHHKRFSVPQTSFQFQGDFKLLKNKGEEFYTYFKAIPPAQYSKLFGQCLDADILNAILKCLAAFSDRGDLDVYETMLQLTQVKRFSMTVMFMSTKDKQVAHGLVEQLVKSGKFTDSQMSALKQKYEL